ncbi:phage integrase family protein [Mycobacterium kansasii]|uniref:Phage integrase family protein n=3 Tax=Mycobacterium TaxID=1763 RepID=A0A1V3WPM7_MYCKA|nr:phage integrase family protein [Mycobacterium kansasii]
MIRRRDMSRQQLPPQIKKLTVRDRRTGKDAVRYQLTVDVGEDPQTGRRRQVRRRYRTEKDARRALSEISDAAEKKVFVPRRTLTVGEMVKHYLAGRHDLRPTARDKKAYDLQPLVERFADVLAQRITKTDIDSLVRDLAAGGTTTAKGRKRRPWSSASVNKSLQAITGVFADAVFQGLLARNPAELVKPLPSAHKDVDTYSVAEVDMLRASFAGDRLAHAYELALVGLRRGEIAGLRWCDVDLKCKTLRIVNNRVSAGGSVSENDPKSKASRRELPLPDRLVGVLRAARRLQAKERLRLGVDAGPFDYVVSNEAGLPYAPPVVYRYWVAAVKKAGLRHLKLHGARHTAATQLALDGVAPAVIAAWLGHTDASFTMKLYTHSQPEALKSAGDTFDRVVTSRDTQQG